MKGIFQSYGKYYDLVYTHKDYERECDFLEEIFGEYSRIKPKTILDGGCGTGGHAIPLARRGYEVTGIDQSEQMISIAKNKAMEDSIDVDFHLMDLRELELHRNFDACICMFSVMGYLTNGKDLSKALFNIREHLGDGSLLIFDFWYGPAVLSISPSPKLKKVEKDGAKIIRFAEPWLDTSAHLCEVDYYFLSIEGNLVLDEGEERHTVRFYFPEEIRQSLEKNSLQLIRLCPFLELHGQPTDRTWNVTAIARAV